MGCDEIARPFGKDLQCLRVRLGGFARRFVLDLFRIGRYKRAELARDIRENLFLRSESFLEMLYFLGVSLQFRNGFRFEDWLTLLRFREQFLNAWNEFRDVLNQLVAFAQL